MVPTQLFLSVNLIFTFFFLCLCSDKSVQAVTLASLGQLSATWCEKGLQN